MGNNERALIVHVVYQFHVGGLENGVVNLINGLSMERFRHIVVSLTDSSPALRSRVACADVEFVDLHKGAGHGVTLYPRLYQLFRSLRPAIVHSRNLAALEAVAPAWAAGVPVRIHGEHGWDVGDPDGSSIKYRLIRRIYAPFVTHYIALSQHLADYLIGRVGISPSRVARICNGVDTAKFYPASRQNGRLLERSPFNQGNATVIGTVGRLQEIKDQLNLVRAFSLLLARSPERAPSLRLMLLGDGPSRAAIEREVAALGVQESVCLAGERFDVPEAMRALDIFVLPSRAEGISNTILEAMASGLPVVATNVGGNAELVVDAKTGMLVPPADTAALADALLRLVVDQEIASAYGRAGRQRAVADFSLDGMVSRYAMLYESLLARSARGERGTLPGPNACVGRPRPK